MKSKRGLSAVVTALILILLVLVAIGIVWFVVNNLITKTGTSVDYTQKCLGISMKPTSASCALTGACTVIVSRATGSTGDAIGGVGITLSNPTTSAEEVTYDGNIAASRTIQFTTTLSTPNRVDVRVYFNDTEGVAHFCSGVESMTVTNT